MTGISDASKANVNDKPECKSAGSGEAIRGVKNLILGLLAGFVILCVIGGISLILYTIIMARVYGGK